MISEKSKVPKRRNFIHDNENFYEKEGSAPHNAPSWTRSGYQDQLKSFVRNTFDRRFGNELSTSPNNNNTTNNQNKPGSRPVTNERPEHDREEFENENLSS